MIENKNLHKVILTRDTVLNLSDVTTVLTRKLLIVKQNAVGGHKLLLGANLIGDVPVNQEPYSETLIETITTDTNVYCYSELSAEFNSGGGSGGNGSIDLSNYFNKQESDARYLFKTALNGYATESWVNSRGYLTSSSLTYYPTKVEVNNMIAAASKFKYIQVAPSAEWNIQHPLNKFPSITLTDNAGNQCMTDVKFIDDNNLTLIFSKPFAGIATLN